MEKKIGRFPFVVEPFSEDYSGHLSWFFLGNHLLRCASLHAGMHGFGYDDVMRSHHVWVLSRLVIELEKMPRTGDSYTVETWVSKIYRQFTDRLYAITGEGGKVFGHGYSVWALIDMDSREAMDFSELPDEGFADAVIDRTVPIKGPGRVRVKAQEPVRSLKASYSDLDINRHVNSIRYIQMILDLFGEQLCQEGQRVRRLDVAYCSESYCGDQLDFFCEKGGEKDYKVEIRKGGTGEVLIRAGVELAL